MTATPADDILRRTGTTVVSLAVAELLGKVATLVMFLLLARLLGLQQFGVLSLGFGFGLLLAVLSSAGLDDRVLQLGSARPELLDRCYGALVGIRLVLCAAICVVVVPIVYAVMDRPEAHTVSLVIIACLAETFTDASRACCGARQAQHLTALILVVQRLATLALVGGALLVEPRAWLAALCYLVGTVIGVAGMHVAARRAGVRLQFAGSAPEARLIIQAVPVMGLNEVASMGLFRIDAALIGVLLGTTAVGIYGANYRVFETILFVSWTLSRAFAPVVASRPDDADHLRVWSQRAMLLMMAVYLPYGVVLGLRGEDIVAALLGAEYADRGLLVALAAAPLLYGVGHLCATVLLAIRPDPVVLVASVLALVVNVGLNLVLIPAVGITGAAAATTLAFLVQASVLWAALHRRAGRLLAPRSLAGVAVGSVAAAAACLVIAPLLPALLVAACGYLAGVVLVTPAVDPALMTDLRALRPPRALGSAVSANAVAGTDATGAGTTPCRGATPR